MLKPYALRLPTATATRRACVRVPCLSVCVCVCVCHTVLYGALYTACVDASRMVFLGPFSILGRVHFSSCLAVTPGYH